MFALEPRPTSMSSRRLILTLFTLFMSVFCPPHVARAESPGGLKSAQTEFLTTHHDQPVVSVRVEGLRRTHPSVVRQWIDCTPGAPLASCDLASIHERIFRLGIFSAVDIDLTEIEGGVDVVFRIEEKWSLYPVPMLWYSPGTAIAGLILVEANLLGYNKGVAVGGVYSNRGWYAIAGYNDPNIAFTNLYGSVHTFLGSGIVENDRPNGSIEQSFDLTRLDVEYSLGWTFFDRISPTLTGGPRFARLEKVRVAGQVPVSDAAVEILGFQTIYSDRRFRELYDEGTRLSVEVQHAFPLIKDTRPYNDAIFDLKWTHPAPLRGFIDAHGRAFLSALPPAFEERLGGLDGSRTIPGTGLVGADKYASMALAYQVPFLTVSPGTATFQIFGEVGRYVRNDEPPVTYGGPGAGLRFYLKKVAIPAMGVDVGYEAESKRMSFSIAIGYRPMR